MWFFFQLLLAAFFHVFLLLFMCPLSVPNERWSVLAAGSNCLEPNSGGVIRETGRSIWLHDCHRLMIMGCNSTLLWSTNHTGLAWMALNANEPWLEYWATARPHSFTPFAPRGIRHMNYGCDPAPPATLSLVPPRMDRFNVNKLMSSSRGWIHSILSTHRLSSKSDTVGERINTVANGQHVFNKGNQQEVIDLWSSIISDQICWTSATC